MKNAVDSALNWNVVTAVVLVIVGVGAVKSIAGDLSYQELVDTTKVLLVGTALGRGLAAYKK